MNKYIIEFIGTFFLVLTVGLAAVHGGAAFTAESIQLDAQMDPPVQVRSKSWVSADFAPLAIGGILMCMIFLGGHISGAHYNPAVSVAVWWRGKCTTEEFPLYVCAQLIGGAVAALFVLIIKSRTTAEGFNLGFVSTPFIPTNFLGAVLVEILFTFALALVVLNVATAKGTAGNSFYGLAIGFTVASGALAAGSISLGVFNPAVGTGLLVMNKLDIGTLGVYVLVQVLAGFLAAVVFKVVNPGD